MILQGARNGPFCFAYRRRYHSGDSSLSRRVLVWAVDRGSGVEFRRADHAVFRRTGHRPGQGRPRFLEQQRQHAGEVERDSVFPGCGEQPVAGPALGVQHEFFRGHSTDDRARHGIIGSDPGAVQMRHEQSVHHGGFRYSGGAGGSDQGKQPACPRQQHRLHDFHAAQRDLDGRLRTYFGQPVLRLQFYGCIRRAVRPSSTAPSSTPSLGRARKTAAPMRTLSRTKRRWRR